MPLPRLAAAIAALTLLPVAAMADEARSPTGQAAYELKAANDAGQAKDDDTYAFGQSLPLFDVAPDRSALYGPSRPLTPTLGTSASFPAETYEAIPEDQPSFGLSIRF